MISIAITACLLIVGSAGISLGQEASKKAIRVSGAGISSEQVQIWAKSFMETNPGPEIIVTGSSAGKGIEALIAKNAEIAMASRVISSDEEKEGGRARDTIGRNVDRVFRHCGNNNPQKPCLRTQRSPTSKIFSGQCVNWKDVGGVDAPIRCLTRRVPESGAALFFQEKVLDKAPYGPTSTATETWGTIIKVCSTANDFPIGIAPVISSLAAKDAIKILAVKEDEQTVGVKPSQETLKDKTYPIILPFRFYWDKKTISPQAEQFIEFCAGKGLASKQ